ITIAGSPQIDEGLGCDERCDVGVRALAFEPTLSAFPDGELPLPVELESCVGLRPRRRMENPAHGLDDTWGAPVGARHERWPARAALSRLAAGRHRQRPEAERPDESSSSGHDPLPER